MSKQEKQFDRALASVRFHQKPASAMVKVIASQPATQLLATKKLLYAFGLLFSLFTTTGATCIPKRSLNEFAPPIIFANTPDVSQISEVLNRTRAIQQLQSNAVSIRIPDLPKLNAKMVWERPRRFRMTGGLSSMTGTDFDLGSNDEIFWMATRHGPQPSLHFARHDQFALQMERQVLPVSPDWLIEALGVIELDPSTVIGTPYVQAQGYSKSSRRLLLRLDCIAEQYRSIPNRRSYVVCSYGTQAVVCSQPRFFRITSLTRPIK